MAVDMIEISQRWRPPRASYCITAPRLPPSSLPHKQQVYHPLSPLVILRSWPGILALATLACAASRTRAHQMTAWSSRCKTRVTPLNKSRTIMAARKVVEVDPGYFLIDKDDADAKYIASTIPGFDFKGIPMFFDIGGLTADPKAFQLTIDIFVERYAAMGVTSVCGLDARGFIFGPPVALRLQVPFFMMRKAGKLPGPTMEVPYKTEYSDETLAVPCSAVRPGDRVVIFDDLIATGGTTIAAANLIVEAGGVVAEVAVVTAIAFFKGWQKFRSSLPQLKDVGIFAIVEATNCLVMPPGSTATYRVAAKSEQHRKLTKALETAKPWPQEVIVREGEGDDATFMTMPRGPKSLREEKGEAYVPE